MEVPQKISKYTFSVTLAYNEIPFLIFHNIVNGTWFTCIFKGTWSRTIFIRTLSSRNTLQILGGEVRPVLEDTQIKAAFFHRRVRRF